MYENEEDVRRRFLSLRCDVNSLKGSIAAVSWDRTLEPCCSSAAYVRTYLCGSAVCMTLYVCAFARVYVSMY